ncbi:hypothetical protein BJ742DRAFT_767164 [Cladochytrium replicatum]|nr:hypothetical protein BJ742DRAFT_767164 [Cladochytrium replicatum]
MTNCFGKGYIDIAISLTDGLVATLANEDDGPFRIVGTYVMSALKWSVAVASQLVPDSSKSGDRRIDFFRGKKIGISRKGWLTKSSDPDSSASSPGASTFDFIVCATTLLDSPLQLKRARRIVKVVARISKTAAEFADPARHVESIDSVVGRLAYSRSHVEEWFVTVRFAKDVRKISVWTILGCAEILREAGIARETNAAEVKISERQLLSLMNKGHLIPTSAV